uniref:Uncharacterized protein n=1 Tax=Cannabis sativa TaxID=3483 RepID=A0A803QCC0_CANSA
MSSKQNPSPANYCTPISRAKRRGTWAGCKIDLRGPEMVRNNCEKMNLFAAKTKSTKASIATLVVAATAMPFIKRVVDTFAIATYLIVFAFLPTFAAVMAVSHKINALLLATTRPWAALGQTNPWDVLACWPPIRPLPYRPEESLLFMFLIPKRRRGQFFIINYFSVVFMMMIIIVVLLMY